MPRPLAIMLLGLSGGGILSALAIVAAYEGRPLCVAGLVVLELLCFVASAMAMGRWGRSVYEKLRQDSQHAAHEAQLQQHRFQAMTALVEGPVLWLSPQGEIVMASHRAQIFGMKPGTGMQAIGDGWLGRLVDEATRRKGKVSLEQLSGGAAGSDGLVRIKDENAECVFAPQAEPVFDTDGGLLGVGIVLWDRTAAKAAEESRRKALSTISHELRTPMTTILMSIHLLLEDAASHLTPRQLELLSAARDDSERLHRMTEELLRKARGEAGA